MSNTNRFHPKPEALPDTLPVFPLQGVLLLPGRQLPLNIFEPRYLNLVFDALGRDRQIGMIQPDVMRGNEDSPALYPAGCAGRITRFNETEDGRLLINLVGVCRFRVGEELRTQRGYRMVAPAWSDYIEDLSNDTRVELERGRLQKALKAYFAVHNIEVDWDALVDMSDAVLVDFLSMNLPFEPQEKQALLEAKTTSDRANILTVLTEMAARGSESPSSQAKH